MFEFKHTVKLADTDSAGVLFFANQFRIIHNAYETFLHLNGLSMIRMLNIEKFRLPLIHAEADFVAPIHVSDELIIQVQVIKFTKSSFTLHYSIYNNGTLSGTAKTSHVSIDLETGNKIELPEQVFRILETIYKDR